MFVLLALQSTNKIFILKEFRLFPAEARNQNITEIKLKLEKLNN